MTLPSIVVVAAAIFDDLEAPTRLLACRRSAPPALAGGWEFPGGKIEPGEDAEGALHRELMEELGVTVRLGSLLRGPRDDGDWPLSDDGAVMRLWLAVIETGEPAALEDHDELRWLPRGRWRDVDWLPADVAIVDRLEFSS